MDDINSLLEGYYNSQIPERRVEFLSQIADRVTPMLTRYIYHKLGDGPHVADVLQESLISIGKGLSTLNSKQSFRSWCYKIATTKIYNFLREKEHRAETAVDPETLMRMVDETASVEPLVEGEREELELAAQIIAKAKGQCHEFLKARYLEGLDLETIGELYGKSADAVRMAINRCVDQIKKNHLN